MIRVPSARLDAALHAGIDAVFFVSAAPELRAAANPVPLIPVILQVDRLRPNQSEDWPVFRPGRQPARRGDRSAFHAEVGVEQIEPLYAGNALGTAMTLDQLALVAEHPGITLEFADLDLLVSVAALDSVVADIGLHAFTAMSGCTGADVTVTVPRFRRRRRAPGPHRLLPGRDLRGAERDSRRARHPLRRHPRLPRQRAVRRSTPA